MEEDLVATISTKCPRVFPDIAPLATPRPYVTYQAFGGPSLRYVDNTASDKRMTFMQINVWADSRKQATTLMREIEDALCAASAFTAKPGSEPRSSTDELGDRVLYGSSQDFDILAPR